MTNTDLIEIDKLLPCPFCGGEAEFHPYKKNGLTLQCKTLGCVSRSQRTLRYSLDWLREKMIEHWNTRQATIDAYVDSQLEEVAHVRWRNGEMETYYKNVLEAGTKLYVKKGK